MDKNDAVSGHWKKKEKNQLTKPMIGHFCCRQTLHLSASGAPYSSPTFSQPLSPQHQESPKVLEFWGPNPPPGAAWRGLLCHHQRSEAVSCRDEEFEVGCRSTWSSGGVWREASWCYIKHWLTLRNHEFLKVSAEEWTKPQAACCLQMSRSWGILGTSENLALAQSFLKFCHYSREETRATYTCQGENKAFVISREISVGISASPIGNDSLR